jgi:hypothetical protein
MLRRIVTFFSLLSFLLFGMIAFMWWRSYRTNDDYGWYNQQWQDWDGQCDALVVCSDSGGLMFAVLHRKLPLAPDHPDKDWRRDNPARSYFKHYDMPPAGYPYMAPKFPGWGHWGFGYFAGARTPPIGPMVHDDRHFVVPYWFVCGLLLVLPAAETRRYYRRRREICRNRQYVCPTCGYDLRATPDRCPECGAIPAQEATT